MCSLCNERRLLAVDPWPFQFFWNVGCVYTSVWWVVWPKTVRFYFAKHSFLLNFVVRHGSKFVLTCGFLLDERHVYGHHMDEMNAKVRAACSHSWNMLSAKTRLEMRRTGCENANALQNDKITRTDSGQATPQTDKCTV